MTRSHVTTLALLFVGTLLCRASAANPQQFSYPRTLESSTVSSRQVAQMDTLLESFVESKKLSSVVGFVSKGGQVLYSKAYGWRDVENRIPATVDDYYVLFSQTKAVTTVAFMTLVEQGKVSVDDPVSKYFPEIPDQVLTAVHPDGTCETRPVKTPMTFAHLMSHTSGLNAGLVHELRKARKAPDERPAGFGGPELSTVPAGQHSGGGNYGAAYLEEEMLALTKYPLGYDPGTHWDYHISTNMLGYLVERISGRPLRAYIKETILDPLGMTRSDWYYEPEALERFVKPYRVVDGGFQLGPTLYSEGTVSRQRSYVEGAIGLNGPIEDYARFCQMLLNKGEFNGHRILRPETVERMVSKNLLPSDGGAGPSFQFGLGFELHKGLKPSPLVSDSAFSWGGMFGTKYLVDPENDLVVLFYTNMYNPENLFPKFLEQAYHLAGHPSATAGRVSEVILENGGTGPHPACVTEEPGLPGITIFRPRDLAPFTGAQKLPILLWGNGACANTAQGHKLFLNEIASQGYLVLAIGLLDQIESPDERSRQATHSAQLVQALDWISGQNLLQESRYFHTLDIAKVAAMGMSCGGLQAIELSGDPRVVTTVVCNSGILAEPSSFKGMPGLTKDKLKDFHGPVLYIMGGASDIAYKNAIDDFLRVDHVPIVMTNLDVGHGGTYHQPHGGDFTRVALAWLDWQLKGRTDRSRFFLGADCELKKDGKWTVETKNFQAAAK